SAYFYYIYDKRIKFRINKLYILFFETISFICIFFQISKANQQELYTLVCLAIRLRYVSHLSAVNLFSYLL
ncbi:hypothetical protein HMPREF0545_1649, partial [Ligilactobacillus salivarius DSM 20555 = ATCC 11741]